MKQLSHQFIIANTPTNTPTLDNAWDTLYASDTCKICSKTFSELYSYLNKHQKEALYNDCENIKDQLIILNKYVPCLTKEEFIIKSIIE